MSCPSPPLSPFEITQISFASILFVLFFVQLFRVFWIKIFADSSLTNSNELDSQLSTDAWTASLVTQSPFWKVVMIGMVVNGTIMIAGGIFMYQNAFVKENNGECDFSIYYLSDKPLLAYLIMSKMIMASLYCQILFGYFSSLATAYLAVTEHKRALPIWVIRTIRILGIIVIAACASIDIICSEMNTDKWYTVFYLFFAFLTILWLIIASNFAFRVYGGIKTGEDSFQTSKKSSQSQLLLDANIAHQSTFRSILALMPNPARSTRFMLVFILYFGLCGLVIAAEIISGINVQDVEWRIKSYASNEVINLYRALFIVGQSLLLYNVWI